jgi:hypothetical protein
MMNRTSVVAVHDSSRVAVVVSKIPMLYRGGPDASLDRPAHVRAASGITRFNNQFAVVQDDAYFLALVNTSTGMADAIPYPVDNGVRQFSEAQGNKKKKADLECIFTLPDGRAVALGSGSNKHRRRGIVFDDVPTWFDASSLYRCLEENTDFSGSQMNLEGATVVGEVLRLFQRGNGAPDGDLLPVNATIDLPLEPLLSYIKRCTKDDDVSWKHPLPKPVVYSLGTLESVRLGFTDATTRNDNTVVFLAAAEDSADVIQDGGCTGSVVGFIAQDGSAVHHPMVNADNTPCVLKCEGITLDIRDEGYAWVTVDSDDTTTPSWLCRVKLP